MKVPGFLFFLILGNHLIASSLEEFAEYPAEDVEISAEYFNDYQESGSSILSGVSKLPSLPYHRIIQGTNFSALSDILDKKSKNYFLVSVEIDPGRDVLKIIYPFHSFF